MIFIMKSTFLLITTLLMCAVTLAQKSPYEILKTEVQPQDLKKDIDTWFDWLHATHPDLSYTVKDIDRLYSSVTQIKDSITTPITVLDFWRLISPLNSQLSDGHAIIGYVSRAIVEDYVSKGGQFFPFEVVFDKNQLLIKSLLGGKESNYNGYSILEINNQPIDTVLSSLLLRISGDSDEHRKAILQKKFAISHMLLFGKRDTFTIKIKQGNKEKTISINGLSTLPKIYETETFNDKFNFRILNSDAAILKIKIFWTDDKKK
jgi:hypothetical protein